MFTLVLIFALSGHDNYEIDVSQHLTELACSEASASIVRGGQIMDDQGGVVVGVICRRE